MSGFVCDLEGFKRQAAKFLRRMDEGTSADALEGAWKALGIFYLNMRGEPWETMLASSVFQHCASRYTLTLAMCTQ